MSRPREKTGKRGAPRLIVDEAQIQGMALRGCSKIAICRYLGISHDTFQRGFNDLYERAKAGGDIAINAAVYDEGANQRNTVMLKLLYENRLGNTPKVHIGGDQENPIQVESKINYDSLSTEDLLTMHAILEKVSKCAS